MASRREEAARAAGKVSLAVLVSRILGLVREQVMAAIFGAGMLMDSWLVAFRIPNMLRDLFAEGAFNSAFVPTFARVLKKEGIGQAWFLANLVINGLMILLGALALLFLIFSDFFVTLLASGFAEVPGKHEIASTMLKILAPFLLMVTLAAVAMGVLNTLNHFFLPALAPAFFNVAIILAALLLVPRFENWGMLGIYAIAVGALAGGCLQFAVQWPLLFREGFRYRFRVSLSHPEIRRLLGLLAPAVIGVSAVQINIVVNTQLASFLGDGPVSWLGYAFRLIYLPIGVFGVAVAVVNLRDVSLLAAQERWDELKATVAHSIRRVGFLSIPAAVGLIVLASPVVATIFERGAFTPQDTIRTSQALIFYAVGLFAYSCVKIYAPTFYALGETRTPVKVSLLAVALNLVINLLLVFWLLPPPYAYLGLAMGTSVAVVFNNVALAFCLRQRLGGLGHQVGRTLSKAGLAGLLMGGVVAAARFGLLESWMSQSEMTQLMGLMLLVGIGVGTYVLLARLFRVEEVNWLWKRVQG